MSLLNLTTRRRGPNLTEKVIESNLSHKEVKNAVRQRKGQKASTNRKATTKALAFPADNGLVVKVAGKESFTLAEVEEALVHAIEETRHRLDNSVWP